MMGKYDDLLDVSSGAGPATRRGKYADLVDAETAAPSDEGRGIISPPIREAPAAPAERPYLSRVLSPSFQGLPPEAGRLGDTELLPPTEEGALPTLRVKALPAGSPQTSLAALSGVAEVLPSNIAARAVGALMPGTRGTVDAPDGTRRQSFGEALVDSESGITRPLRDRLNATNSPRPLKLAGNIALGAFDDPTLLAGAAGRLGRLATAALPERGRLAGNLLHRPSGIQLSPAQALGQDTGPRALMERTAQLNPLAEGIPRRIQRQNVEVLQDNVRRQGERQGADQLGDLDKSTRGQGISDATRGARRAIGETFREAEEQSLGAIRGRPVPSNPEGANLTVDGLDNHLRTVGHTPGQPVTNTNRVSRDAIETVLEIQQDAGRAQSLDELLNVRRNIGRTVFRREQQGGVFQDVDRSFVEGAYHRINDAIGESFGRYLPEGQAEELRGVFEAMNREYSQNREAIQAVAKGLGAGRRDFRADLAIDRIARLGPDRLERLQTLAAGSPDVAPLFEEVRRGAFESLVKKSMNPQSLEVTPDRFMSNWNKLDGRVKRALLDQETLQELDGLVQDLGRATLNDIRRQNPSGTGKMVSTAIAAVTAPVTLLPGILHRLAVTRYYRTGELPWDSVFNLGRETIGRGARAGTSLGRLAPYSVPSRLAGSRAGQDERDR